MRSWNVLTATKMKTVARNCINNSDITFPQILTFLLAAVTVRTGAEAQTLSRHYLPAEQGRPAYPDRQYLPAVPGEPFAPSNQPDDDSRFDDEDSVSVTSAAFGGSRTAAGRFGGEHTKAFGASGVSGQSGVPSNQYGVPNAVKGLGNGAHHNAAYDASVRYGSGPSNQYGAPDASNRFSNGPSNQYGVPSASSRFINGPSNQYGAPDASSRFINGPSNQHGAPDASNQFISAPSKQYGVPLASSRFAGHNPSDQYSIPANGHKQNVAADTSNHFGGIAPSQQYDTPGASTRFENGFIQNIATDASSRFGGFPSNQYGLPDTSRRFGSPAPSTQYGVPGVSRLGVATQPNQYDAISSNFRNINGEEDALSVS